MIQFKFCYIDIQDRVIQFPDLKITVDPDLFIAHLQNNLNASQVENETSGHIHSGLITGLRAAYGYTHLSVIFYDPDYNYHDLEFFGIGNRVGLVADILPLELLYFINKTNSLKVFW